MSFIIEKINQREKTAKEVNDMIKDLKAGQVISIRFNVLDEESEKEKD